MKQPLAMAHIDAGPHWPGVICYEETCRLVHDELLAPLLVAVLLSIQSAVERWAPEQPAAGRLPAYATLASLAILYLGYKIWHIAPRLLFLSRSRREEQAVAARLERLSDLGYRVFNGVIGPGFKLDHVLIGPGGVFAVETVGFARPARGEARLFFDGQALHVNDQPPDSAPIGRVQAQARWLSNTLSEANDHWQKVTPLILACSWPIEQPAGLKPETVVLNSMAMREYLEHLPIALEAQEVCQASYRVSELVRNTHRLERLLQTTGEVPR